MVASTDVNELERLLIAIIRRDHEQPPSPYSDLKGMVQVSSQVMDAKASVIRLSEAREWQPAIPLMSNVHLLMTPARHGTLLVKTDRGTNVRIRPFDLAALTTVMSPPERRAEGERRFGDLIASARRMAER